MFRDLLRDDLQALVPLLLTGVAGVVGARFGAGRSILRYASDHPWQLAAATGVTCAVLSAWAYQSTPQSMDEVAPLFQARVFVTGRLAARFAPEQLEWLFGPHRLGVFFFAQPETGEVVSAYWPGLALLLVPFEAVGAALLLNPLLAAAAVRVLRYVAFTTTHGDREATGAALLLLIGAPSFVINGAAFFAMNAHLLANLAFVALLLEPTSRRLVAAGAVGGFALSLHNPFPHLLFAWPWWLLQLRARDRARRLAFLATGYLPVALLLVVGWYLFAQSLREPGGAVMGASAFRFPDGGQLLTRALGLSKLLLWAPVLLCPLAIAFGWRAFRARQPVQRALGLSALSFLVAYLVVKFDQGHGWGYRYFHPAFAALPLLAAGGLAARASAEREGLLAAIAIGALASVALLLPQRSLQVAAVVAAHQRELTPHDAGKTCVHFIDPTGYYTADLIVNRPDLRGDLFLRDRGPAEVAALRERYFPKVTFERRWRRDTTYCGDLTTYARAARR